MYTVNGIVNVKGKDFYRLDHLGERHGLDFLANPAALVADQDLAHKIVTLLNT